MRYSISKLLFCFIQLWSVSICLAQKCTKTGPCSCESAKGIIDLSPLKGNPRFKDLKAKKDDGYVYSYNPCTPFTEGNDCQNVASCQVKSGAENTEFPIGLQESAVFSTDEKSNPVITYTAKGKLGVTRSTVVTLICGTKGTDKLEVEGESEKTVYSMKLTSPHCCPKAHPSGNSGTSLALSAGSILLIVVVGVLLVYIVVGVIIQKGVRKAEGKEAIPNYSFWSSLPGYIKDGVLFTFSKCSRQSRYDRI